MATRLNTFVALLDDELNSHYFGPDDHVPGWARKRIQNPDVWVDEPDVSDDYDLEGDDPDTGDTGDTGDTAGDADDEPDASGIPPKAGPGSSANAWAAYAHSKGFEADADAKASEIREALNEAGIATE